MEKSFIQVRKELDDLGYTETLKPECLPLVRRLLGDLKITTDSLRKYMKISQQALEERDNLQFGAEPYKCDNAKLIRECNELHLAFIQFKEQHEKVQRDLRAKIVSLDNQLTDCNIEKQKLKIKLQELQSGFKPSLKKGQSKSQPSVSTTRSVQSQLITSSDTKMSQLSDDIKHLKEEQIHLLKNNEFLMLQLENRDQEIKRLTNLLEGGRPTKAVVNDCCYKNIDNKIGSLQDEITNLKREKNTLQNQLREAILKQHEAMKRALSLAERNKQLEGEMKDIDQIALSVEAECNNTVKSNIEKVTRLQDKINESVMQIQNLERDNYKLTVEKTELLSELEAVKLEKKKLQLLLENESEDKKRLTDRLNNFTIIEQDLNMEIDRLLRVSGEQKRKIAELESELTAGKIRTYGLENEKASLLRSSQETERNFNKQRPSSDIAAKVKPHGKVQHKEGCKKASKSRETSPVQTSKTLRKDSAGTYDPKLQSKCCCEAGGCIKWMKQLLDKEIEHRQQQANQQIESLKKEKDHYVQEYHKLLERPKSTPSTYERSSKQIDDLLNRIKEKDDIILTLQDDVKTLNNDKYALTSRLEAQSREINVIDIDGPCSKTSCKRKTRELDVHREEVRHLEREINTLKSKLQTMTENSVFNEDRMKKAFQDMEEHITRLENERRDLVISQGTSRSNVSHLEDECRILKEKLSIAQKDANAMKANYEQLKILHDQANRALSEAQTQLLKAEGETQNIKSRLNSNSRETNCYEREISRLQGDIDVMKSQLTKIDKEKDELLNVVDDKTEKIDKLETELREKKNKIGSLETEIKDLCRKVRSISDDKSSQDLQLRNSKQEINILTQDLENERRSKEAAIQENRRLQEDLSSVSLDCRDARKELEIARRQVEDLKRQLQHYVAEVKRTEDLISQKELERTEILDQFKSLSQENNVLETTNHTLESEASQSRVQLSVALDHASDLERKLENQESIIKSYEKQMADLTSQVASLEIQLKQNSSSYDRSNIEMKQLKDLCLRLDNEKEELKRELRNKEEQKINIDRKLEFLTRERDDLRRKIEKEEDGQTGLERLLNEARQEICEQRLLNEDLQSEVSKLRKKVDELQERLSPQTSTTVDLSESTPETQISSTDDISEANTGNHNASIVNRCEIYTTGGFEIQLTTDTRTQIEDVESSDEILTDPDLNIEMEDIEGEITYSDINNNEEKKDLEKDINISESIDELSDKEKNEKLSTDSYCTCSKNVDKNNLSRFKKKHTKLTGGETYLNKKCPFCVAKQSLEISRKKENGSEEKKNISKTDNNKRKVLNEKSKITDKKVLPPKNCSSTQLISNRKESSKNSNIPLKTSTAKTENSNKIKTKPDRKGLEIISKSLDKIGPQTGDKKETKQLDKKSNKTFSKGQVKSFNIPVTSLTVKPIDSNHPGIFKGVFDFEIDPSGDPHPVNKDLKPKNKNGEGKNTKSRWRN